MMREGLYVRVADASELCVVSSILKREEELCFVLRDDLFSSLT